MMWQKKCFPAKRDNERGCCSIDDFSFILQQPLLSSVRVGFPLKGINFESLLDQVYHKQKSTHHEMSVQLDEKAILRSCDVALNSKNKEKISSGESRMGSFPFPSS